MTTRRARARGIVAGIACAISFAIATAGEAHAYAFLLVPESRGVVRHWQLDQLPDARVPWRLSRFVGDNVTGDRSPEEVLRAAFAAWEDVPDAAIGFAFAGVSGDRNRSTNDRVNLMALGSQESLGAGVLAATFVTTTTAGAIVDADIVFDSAVPYSTGVTPDPERYDLQAVATHEIGHLIGLEHTPLVRATMVPYSERAEALARTPESDDAIGAALLYPEPGFLGRTGTIQGRVAIGGGRGVFLASVVASTIGGRVVAGAVTDPDGNYRIAGLPADVYIVLAEPLDGPVQPRNLGGFAAGFGGPGDPIVHGTAFH